LVERTPGCPCGKWSNGQILKARGGRGGGGEEIKERRKRGGQWVWRGIEGAEREHSRETEAARREDAGGTEDWETTPEAVR